MRRVGLGPYVRFSDRETDSPISAKFSLLSHPELLAL